MLANLSIYAPELNDVVPRVLEPYPVHGDEVHNDVGHGARGPRHAVHQHPPPARLRPPYEGRDGREVVLQLNAGVI